LKRQPLQANRTAKCENCDDATNATEHAYETREQLRTRQFAPLEVAQASRQPPERTYRTQRMIRSVPVLDSLPIFSEM
jgi:hypothetical protein